MAIAALLSMAPMASAKSMASRHRKLGPPRHDEIVYSVGTVGWSRDHGSPGSPLPVEKVINLSDNSNSHHVHHPYPLVNIAIENGHL